MTDDEAKAPKSIPNNKEVGETQKYRQFKSPSVRFLWYITLVLIPIIGFSYILGIHQMLGLPLYREQYIGFFLGMILFGIYLSIPASKRSPRDRVPWYDWILATLGLIAGFYILFLYPQVVMALANVTTARFIISVGAILLILEAIRRVLGKGLLIVVSVFLFYGYFAPYFPGVFKGSETSASQFFNYLYLDSSSLLSLLGIAATVILSFIFFGQVLLFLGGGDILNELALSLFGRFRGGPAKGSIVGSSLVGSITGGPVANVVLTGSVTIPLMKRNGYTSAQAGAIESVASTGGSIMPPVMGIAAFIIAETLGISYAEVALAALVPAILFYACLFFQVDLMAGRKNLRPLSKEDIPVLKIVMAKGWMIIPIIASLIYFLFIVGYSPQKAGLYASVVAFVFLVFKKTILKNFFRIFPRIFIETGKVLQEIGIVLAAAGLVVGVVGITGLGFRLGFVLTMVGDYGLFILLVLCAVASIILGMGMPSIAAYALVAVLVAPTIVELGVAPLAAHLFVFYFAILSNFTPPVAMACFTAAPIAQERPNKIAIQAARLGIIGYLVPFLFVYAPGMLIGLGEEGQWPQTMFTIGTILVSCYLLSMALEGYLFQRLKAGKRTVVAILGVCLLLPVSIWEHSWIINCIALILSILFLINEKSIYNKKGEGPNIIQSELNR